MGYRKYISVDLPLGTIWSFFSKYLASLSLFWQTLQNLSNYHKDTKIMSQAVPSTSGDGGGGGEPSSSVELTHGVSDLPGGYGKISGTATMLPKHCSNDVHKIV